MVDGQQVLDRFELDHKLTLDDEVDPIERDLSAAVVDTNRDLSFDALPHGAVLSGASSTQPRCALVGRS